MNSLDDFNAALDSGLLATYSCEHATSLLNYFADHVDNDIQTDLFYELMARYAYISKHLEVLVAEKVKALTASQTATIHALVKAAEARDDDTGAHVERTASYCKLIAQQLWTNGLYKDIVDEHYAEQIAMASPLHDVGKIGIPDAILLKPGRLEKDEFAVMKTHATIGYDTLSGVEGLTPENTFLKFGMEISQYHHEKWDGSGYMKGLAGEEIPLSARIMALADVYDALRSKRIYKEPFTHDRTVEIITEGRGSHFDPVIVDVFLANHQQFNAIFERLSKV